MAEDKNNGMLNWDSTIEDDGKSGNYVVLEEGDYSFEVTKFSRTSWKGSTKIPAGCNVASYTLTIKSGDSEATCVVDIPLHTSMEWKIASFFRCLGMKKHGEKITPDWMGAVTKKGVAHFKPRDWGDGSGKKSNDVAYFIDYNDEKVEETSKAQAFEKAEDDIPF